MTTKIRDIDTNNPEIIEILRNDGPDERRIQVKFISEGLWSFYIWDEIVIDQNTTSDGKEQGGTCFYSLLDSQYSGKIETKKSEKELIKSLENHDFSVKKPYNCFDFQEWHEIKEEHYEF